MADGLLGGGPKAPAGRCAARRVISYRLPTVTVTTADLQASWLAALFRNANVPDPT